MSRRKRFVVVAALVAGACLAAGIGYAAIPSGNTITACYLKGAGFLRVIDPSQTSCSRLENQLQWNQQGIPGRDGKDGKDGTNGVSGYELVQTAQEITAPFINDPTENEATVFCPTGKVATGGGGLVQLYNAAGFVGTQATHTSLPVRKGSVPDVVIGWVLRAVTPIPAGVTREVVNLYVICVSAG